MTQMSTENQELLSFSSPFLAQELLSFSFPFLALDLLSFSSPFLAQELLSFSPPFLAQELLSFSSSFLAQELLSFSSIPCPGAPEFLLPIPCPGAPEFLLPIPCPCCVACSPTAAQVQANSLPGLLPTLYSAGKTFSNVFMFPLLFLFSASFYPVYGHQLSLSLTPLYSNHSSHSFAQNFPTIP